MSVYGAPVTLRVILGTVSVMIVILGATLVTKQSTIKVSCYHRCLQVYHTHHQSKTKLC